MLDVASVYERAGRLRLVKVDPPIAIVRGVVIQKENPFLDFIGAWTERAGRLLAIEAKETTEPRLAVGGASGLNRKQLDAIANWNASGALAFLLWRHAGEVKLWPYQHIHAASKGRSSIRWEAGGVRCPQGIGYILFDFRAVMQTVFQ